MSKVLVKHIIEAADTAGIETSPEAVAFALGYATASNAPKLSTEPFRVYYHENISGRAQGAFMLLADGGVEYERKTPADITDPTVFAVPAVECGGHWRSQTLAVVRFIAERIGYEVPIHLSSLAEKLCLDIADVWSEVYGQSVRHKGQGIPDLWIDSRLTRWLKVC